MYLIDKETIDQLAHDAQIVTAMFTQPELLTDAQRTLLDDLGSALYEQYEQQVLAAVSVYPHNPRAAFETTLKRLTF